MSGIDGFDVVDAIGVDAMPPVIFATAHQEYALRAFDAQALDYRLPMKPGRGVAAAHELVRARTPHREADYLFHEDLAPVTALVRGRELLDAAGLV